MLTTFLAAVVVANDFFHIRAVVDAPYVPEIAVALGFLLMVMVIAAGISSVVAASVNGADHVVADTEVTSTTAASDVVVVVIEVSTLFWMLLVCV